jgi:hypothetical protein
MPALASDATLRPRTACAVNLGASLGRGSGGGAGEAASSFAGQTLQLFHAHHQAYNTDSAIAGTSTLATRIAHSPVKPWTRPRSPPPSRSGSPQAGGRRQHDAKAHLGPGSYGILDGTAAKPGAGALVFSTLERFQDAHSSAVRSDAVGGPVALPPHLRTQAHVQATLSSTVPRFLPIPGENSEHCGSGCCTFDLQPGGQLYTCRPVREPEPSASFPPMSRPVLSLPAPHSPWQARTRTPT